MQSERFYYCPIPTCTSIYRKRAAHSEHSDELERIPLELTDEFDFKKKLGSGANGVVFQIYDKDDEVNKAMKLLNVSRKEEMKTELKILLRLHHQYIVRYFKSGMCKKKAFIIMESCDMNLNDYMNKMKKELTEENKIRIFLQICQGIEYFHHHEQGQIVHRDLKLSNILMVENNVRISDFGESKIMESQSKSTGIRGTLNYFPPELLSLDDDTKIVASPKHDIWSLGIMAHQIFADGQHPFKIPNSDNLWKKNVMDGKYSINYKHIAKGSPIDLTIQGCLFYKPQDRYDIKDILNLFSSSKIIKNPALKIIKNPAPPNEEEKNEYNGQRPIFQPSSSAIQQCKPPSTRDGNKNATDENFLEVLFNDMVSSSSAPPLPPSFFPSPPLSFSPSPATFIPQGKPLNQKISNGEEKSSSHAPNSSDKKICIQPHIENKVKEEQIEQNGQLNESNEEKEKIKLEKEKLQAVKKFMLSSIEARIKKITFKKDVPEYLQDFYIRDFKIYSLQNKNKPILIYHYSENSEKK